MGFNDDLFKALGDEGYTGTLNDRMVKAMRAAQPDFANAGYNTLIYNALEAEYALGSFSANYKAWRENLFTIVPILGAGGGGGYTFTGGFDAFEIYGGFTSSTTGSDTLTLDLSADVGYLPSAGDLIYVHYGHGNASNVAMSATTNAGGITQLTEFYTSSGGGINAEGGYRVCTGTETSITFTTNAAASNAHWAGAIIIKNGVSTGATYHSSGANVSCTPDWAGTLFTDTGTLLIDSAIAVTSATGNTWTKSASHVDAMIGYSEAGSDGNIVMGYIGCWLDVGNEDPSPVTLSGTNTGVYNVQRWVATVA